MEKQKERLNRNQIIKRIIDKYREKFFSLIKKIGEYNKGLEIFLFISAFFACFAVICLLGGFIMLFGFLLALHIDNQIIGFIIKAIFVVISIICDRV